MNTDEINRLLRVTTPSLRKGWEAKKLGGRSLEALKQIREEALVKRLSEARRFQILSVIIVAVALVSIIVSGCVSHRHAGSFEKYLILSLGIAVDLIIAIYALRRFLKTMKSNMDAMAECDVAFESFGKSVDALNPLGIGNTYHDLITTEVIDERIVDLAERVISVEDSFEADRANKKISRSSLVHNYQWIVKCESKLQMIWNSACDDFGLPFDRPTVINRAVAQFVKRHGRRPVHMPT